jgi:hypothetical protein
VKANNYPKGLLAGTKATAKRHFVSVKANNYPKGLLAGTKAKLVMFEV